MNSIGIFYGSSVGNTRFVAEKIGDIIKTARLYPVENAKMQDLENTDTIILGTSTWGFGNMQDDFENFVQILLNADLKGKKVALFGLGDQYTYPDTFCNGMGNLYQLIKNKGCDFIGKWPSDSYDFSESTAIEGNYFVGLALDEDNEPDLTNHRLTQWIESLNIH
ncbi:flavodoxin [Plebeiibacterium marinum]|uniref:Flavodoxin n=1 Tax=Plebeiibacterium marinum TaxID=2992111 RepID=A0AAE3SLJ7_9BACT|nr:flavodoxin [Plebeiobacterium marinum]MCW3807534.1 flavodoxin [Plebeiobacterium marinum]